VLALDGLTDPRNVGASLRTAAAVGVDAVIMARDRAPGLSPALVKAAAGAVEWVRIARVVNLSRTLGALREAGFWVVGLDGAAEHELYAPGAFPGLPCVLVVGAEGDGLRSLTRRVCHRLLRIPLRGNVESLNVSVALGVALFELHRQSAAGTA
jgi:23S rRNA (guanosine2251-2'-O)-methyltransferase